MKPKSTKTTKSAKTTRSKAARSKSAVSSTAASAAAPAPVQDYATVTNDAAHPDHLDGIVDDGLGSFTPNPDNPFPPMPPVPFPPHPPVPFPPQPQPIPGQPGFPPVQPGQPLPPPLQICAAVSGRYRSLVAAPVMLTVRVDVDRFFPQRRISVEAATTGFPLQRAHIIAEVTSDRCLAFNRRRITASITYRDGSNLLLAGDSLVFEASRVSGIVYNNYRLTMMQGSTASPPVGLAFVSRFFDAVEFEVDTVSNAGRVVTSYDTGAHPNRPASLTAERLALATVYQRAGFDVTMSPNTSTIPVADAGANTTWSDAEMHNAMVTYWSRFSDRPQWAMWVLYAARHDSGRSLGGVMFDDIGTQHRQGTAIFTDSFIQDAPANDPAAAAWRDRMVFWTAIHEMGHAFNLAHSWQKSLGSPWVPLANEPEVRSFMNYPFRVSGGESAFFRDFGFRFSDSELVFMRHAPRRFVQMGSEEWFVNHGFEAPDQAARFGWELTLRTNRASSSFRFMEPVAVELKLTNHFGRAMDVEEDLLEDGRHCSLIVRREGGSTRMWRAMRTACHEPHKTTLVDGKSIYGTHLVSASTQGWLIDEPGFYQIQAAVQVDGETIKSDVLRIYVATASTDAEHLLAPDYFTEDVGRVLNFSGAPSLVKAVGTLETVAATLGHHPAALHARLALSTPLMASFKTLETTADGGLVIHSNKADLDAASKTQRAMLVKDPDEAARTLGHITYYGAMDRLAAVLKTDGDTSGARTVLQTSVTSMKKRGVLESVIKAEENKLAKVK